MQVRYSIRPEVIDMARERLGLTSDEQLAAHLGISGGTVTRIRRGASPQMTTAMKLLEAADVGPWPGVDRHPPAA